MNAPASSSRRIRTGLFEIDLDAGEVRKDGRKVPLQEQPFRLLAILLECPGEMVTRERLQEQLWSADTYVSFDEGLNTAVRKLRVVFGDSAENPRFIETIPRRGYRFIAPVTESAKSNALPEPFVAIEDVPTTADESATEGTEFHGQGGGTETAGHPKPSARRIRPWTWKLAVSLAGSVVLVLACLAYVMRLRPSPPSASSKRAILAILPFLNLSGDPAQEYFPDGLTEETITDLGQLSPAELGVIARTSAMAYKHTDKTISQIGQELGADFILEGSVRRDGGKTRVTAQLIRVSDQTHLWAHNYDRDMHDLLDMENELGKTIAQQVQVNLSPQRQMALSKMRTVDPEAYDLYLKGRYYWNQRTPAGIKQSIGYFQQAVSRDPNFALAYTGLAAAYNIGNFLGVYSPKESMPQVKEAASKAIALDPFIAEAHAALGLEMSHYEFDFPGAEKEFLKAIEVNPNSAYAHLFYSNSYLMPMARVQEAIAENKKALELDPLSMPINNFMAMTYLFAADYEKSYQQFQHTIELNPTFPLAHDYFSWLLYAMGRFEQGIQEHQKSELLSGASPEGAAAEADAALKALKSGGERGFWQWNLDVTLKALKRADGSVPPSAVAAAYALAGDKDKAFQWLDKAYEERDGQDIALLKCTPGYKNLRADPRFAALLRRLGLPE